MIRNQWEHILKEKNNSILEKFKPLCILCIWQWAIIQCISENIMINDILLQEKSLQIINQSKQRSLIDIYKEILEIINEWNSGWVESPTHNEKNKNKCLKKLESMNMSSNKSLFESLFIRFDR